VWYAGNSVFLGPMCGNGKRIKNMITNATGWLIFRNLRILESQKYQRPALLRNITIKHVSVAVAMPTTVGVVFSSVLCHRSIATHYSIWKACKLAEVHDEGACNLAMEPVMTQYQRNQTRMV
jgi:hypothetical protein